MERITLIIRRSISGLVIAGLAAVISGAGSGGEVRNYRIALLPIFGPESKQTKHWREFYYDRFSENIDTTGWLSILPEKAMPPVVLKRDKLPSGSILRDIAVRFKVDAAAAAMLEPRGREDTTKPQLTLSVCTAKGDHMDQTIIPVGGFNETSFLTAVGNSARFVQETLPPEGQVTRCTGMTCDGNLGYVHFAWPGESFEVFRSGTDKDGQATEIPVGHGNILTVRKEESVFRLAGNPQVKVGDGIRVAKGLLPYPQKEWDNALLAMDFAQKNDLEGWTTFHRWRLTENQVSVRRDRKIGNANARAHAPPAQWTDYRVECDVILQPVSSPWVGIVCRSANWETGVIFSYVKFKGGPKGQVSWQFVENGKVGLQKRPKPITVSGRDIYHMAVECRGSKFRGYVDGKLVSEIENDKFPSGGVGFFQYMAYSGWARFDNLMVSPLPEEEPAPSKAGS